jgi:hypothetical protein
MFSFAMTINPVAQLGSQAIVAALPKLPIAMRRPPLEHTSCAEQLQVRTLASPSYNALFLTNLAFSAWTELLFRARGRI